MDREASPMVPQCQTHARGALVKVLVKKREACKSETGGAEELCPQASVWGLGWAKPCLDKTAGIHKT